jgi:hypothetical protein
LEGQSLESHYQGGPHLGQTQCIHNGGKKEAGKKRRGRVKGGEERDCIGDRSVSACSIIQTHSAESGGGGSGVDLP